MSDSAFVKAVKAEARLIERQRAEIRRLRKLVKRLRAEREGEQP